MPSGVGSGSGWQNSPVDVSTGIKDGVGLSGMEEVEVDTVEEEEEKDVDADGGDGGAHEDATHSAEAMAIAVDIR